MSPRRPPSSSGPRSRCRTARRSNDIWGAGAGSPCIWADSGTNWGVWAVNKTGAVGPLGTSQGTLTLGDSTWTVYKGNNGSNDVFSFVRSSNAGSGTVNILPILKWIKESHTIADRGRPRRLYSRATSRSSLCVR